MDIHKKPPIPKHPSFGYATAEQIKRLEELGLCPERDYILQKIELQNQKKGVMD